SFTKDPYSITAAANGIDFAISLDEAKSIITGDKKEYEIPLKVLRPTVSNDDLGIDAFPDELASYSTNYSSSGASRSNNIALATSKINGTVLMPGETFSYNGIVGRRTKEAGFQEAGAYSNGQVVNEVGGGICQVSSTLYNAVLRSNLEVTDRHNHMFQVNYCPIGTDATVSWGAPDFKFKNNRNYA
ncbi:VanW family protein, partial [Ralstonia pseudosolanacearum]|uniref:VanW family protein n=1 Tax=Ralstonia pseudosolanacearum TaxID=1310165 RepID=UPI003CE7564B